MIHGYSEAVLRYETSLSFALSPPSHSSLWLVVFRSFGGLVQRMLHSTRAMPQGLTRADYPSRNNMATRVEVACPLLQVTLEMEAVVVHRNFPLPPSSGLGWLAAPPVIGPFGVYDEGPQFPKCSVRSFGVVYVSAYAILLRWRTLLCCPCILISTVAENCSSLPPTLSHVEEGLILFSASILAPGSLLNPTFSV